MLEKASVLPVGLVNKGDWMVAKALHRQQVHDGPELVRWAPPDIILVAARSWQQLQCPVLAAISLRPPAVGRGHHSQKIEQRRARL